MLEWRRALLAMTAVLVMSVHAPAYAGAGDLDPSFAQDGKLSLVSAGSFVARAVAVQADGRILVGGYTCEPGPSGNGLCQSDGDSSFRLARFTRDGGLDTEWGDKGLVTTPVGTGRSQIFDLLLQPGGQVVAGGVAREAGRNSFALARYDARGALTSDFGGDGVVTTPVGTGFSAIADLTPGPAGTIVAVGQARDDADRERMAVARYSADGAQDASFGAFGSVLAGDAGYGYALGGWADGDGNVVAAGLSGASAGDTASFRTGVVRLTAGGGVTRSEAHAIGSSSSFANALTGLPDGRWLSAGAATDGEGRQVMAVLRGLPGGGLDPEWDRDGAVLVRSLAGAVANDLVRLDDGRVIVAGQAATGTGEQHFALARLLPSGPLDGDFAGGVVTTAWSRFRVARVTSAAVDGEGRTLAAGIGCVDGAGSQCDGGRAYLALARYLGDPPSPSPPPPPPPGPLSPGSPGADTRAPAARLSLPRSMRRRTLARTGLLVRVQPDEESTVTVTLRTRRGTRLVVLARRTLAYAAGRRTLRLRPARRRLPRSRRFTLRVSVRVTDRARNAATLDRNVRIRG